MAHKTIAPNTRKLHYYIRIIINHLSNLSIHHNFKDTKYYSVQTLDMPKIVAASAPYGESW